MTRARRHLASEYETTREIWPAFTDVMSTMSLILFVLVLLAYVRNLLSVKQLDALHAQIAVGERSLHLMKDDLSRTAADLSAQKAALAASNARLADQELVITDSNQQLGALRAQLQSIAVLRIDVLDKLKSAIEAELGPSNSTGAALVTIGDNGDLVLNESLVFETGSWAIKNQAKPLLEGLAKALGNLLADESVRENIDTIVIQGHTDEVGAASFNWDLSAKRATAVLQYLFQVDKTLADSYGRYFSASAYSKFRPINTATTPDALQQNRRIEISVVPRDTNVRKVIDEYMKNVPAPPGNSPH